MKKKPWNFSEYSEDLYFLLTVHTLVYSISFLFPPGVLSFTWSDSNLNLYSHLFISLTLISFTVSHLSKILYTYSIIHNLFPHIFLFVASIQVFQTILHVFHPLIRINSFSVLTAYMLQNLNVIIAPVLLKN